MPRQSVFYVTGMLLCILCLHACGERISTPKPKGYPRVVYPDRGYQSYAPAQCPFSFDYPTYSNIKKDEKFFDVPAENNCWMDIELKPFNGQIHLSYKAIDHPDKLAQLMEDAHKLTTKHVVKADYIDDFVIQNEHSVNGMLYEIGGNTASALQFYLTDEENHFLRGSLYFRATPNADSLQPILDFVRKDIDRLISTFEWKES